MASQVVDADRGLHWCVHAAARHHDRERRAARYPARVLRVVVRPAVGHRRVRADPCGVPADRGFDRGPPRTAAHVRHRDRGLHARIGALRRCDRTSSFLSLARALQGVGGAIMFAISLALARPGIQAVRARGRIRRVRRVDRRGGRGRTGARRRDHEWFVVALDLLREHSDRSRRPYRDAAASRRVALAGRTPNRLVGMRAVQRRPGRARVRTHSQPGRWLDARRPCSVRSIASAVLLGRVRRWSSRAHSRRCSISGCCASPRSTVASSPRGASRRRSSRCSPTSCSICRTSSATRRCRPACDSCR